MNKFRTEGDSLGTMEVPANAYYGIQSLRARNNFGITGYKISSTFIKSMAKSSFLARIYIMRTNNSLILSKLLIL